MRVELAAQYGVPCVVLDGNEDADKVISLARDSEAIFYEDGDENFVVRLPGRLQELYTETALRGSLPQ